MFNNIKTRHACFHEITYPVIITVVMDCSIPIVDETIFTNFFSQCSVCALNKASKIVFYCMILISKNINIVSNHNSYLVKSITVFFIRICLDTISFGTSSSKLSCGNGYQTTNGRYTYLGSKA